MKVKDKKRGFTLIELLVVLAVLTLFAAITMAAITNTRLKSRDTRRIADMNQIQRALELYLNTYNQYPSSENDGCATIGGISGYDMGVTDSSDNFINILITAGAMPTVPGDPFYTGCALGTTPGYVYRRFNAGTNGCPTAYGAYYVLGVYNMESSSGSYKDSPGFGLNCTHDFQSDFEWVTGRFELK